MIGQINRKECYSCPYRRATAADIRLGDYYKSGDLESYSVVIPISSKGVDVLNSISDYIEIYPLEYRSMDDVQEKGDKKIPKTREDIFRKSEQGISPREILGWKGLLLQYIKGLLKKIFRIIGEVKYAIFRA